MMDRTTSLKEPKLDFSLEWGTTRTRSTNWWWRNSRIPYDIFFFLRCICMSVITLVRVNSKQSKVYMWPKFQNLNPGISIRTFQFESLSFKFWTNYYFYYLFLVCFRSRFAVVQKLYFRLIDRMWAEVSSVDGTEVLKERYIIPDTSFIEFLVILRITNFEICFFWRLQNSCVKFCVLINIRFS